MRSLQFSGEGQLAGVVTRCSNGTEWRSAAAVAEQSSAVWWECNLQWPWSKRVGGAQRGPARAAWRRTQSIAGVVARRSRNVHWRSPSFVTERDARTVCWSAVWRRGGTRAAADDVKTVGAADEVATAATSDV